MMHNIRKNGTSWWRVIVINTLIATALAPSVARAATPPGDGLTNFELLLLGLTAHPEPETQVVPRNTPTGIHVALEFGSTAIDPVDVLSLLPSGLELAAELVGPGITTPIELRGRPGDLLPIPPLVDRGMYLVRDIRLELDGDFFLRANPDTANIQVIERVIVTQVTTRPLDAEEIRQKGILFGDENFQAFNFTLALKLDSRPVNIDFPVVFDENDIPIPTRETGRLDLRGGGGGNPFVNAQIQPVMLQLKLPEMSELEMPEGIGDVSIPGLLVIPGDVGFLNQFFSAMLVVSNAAPLGSGLSVHDLEATIVLPNGDDDVAGTTDDPLVVAETASGAAFTLPVVGLGADGIVATGDDTRRFDPGEQGQAEYLLEGKKEGFHDIEFDITGTLDGLPIGPVDITGSARGGVVVRNPFFNVTFSAPRTVRRLEPFTLFVNVTNTSESIANYVNVTLNAFQLSGAELLSGPTVTVDTLGPGDSETLRFQFRSLKTGEVTASYLNFESGGTENEGDLTFALGVDERGTPLSPDTLVLPTSVEALPAPLVDQALRVLGQAWSLATAPEGTIPEGVLRVTKQSTIDRAVELAEAGLRVQLGDALDASLASLALTWLATDDPGFDQLMRETDAGEAFQRAVGKEIGTTDPIALFHENLSSGLTSQAPHLQASVGDSGGAAPVTWELVDSAGRALRVDGAPGGADLFSSDLPNAGFLPLTDPVDGGRGTALVPVLAASSYELRWTASGTGSLDVSVSVPKADGSVGIHSFAGVVVATGDTGRVVLDLVTPPASLTMEIDADGDGAYESTVDSGSELLETPSGPVLLTATVVGPETVSGADSFGRAVVLLIDRELDSNSADLGENYVLEGNRVLSARTQLSGRLVFLFLEKPAGDLVTRQLSTSALYDTTGRAAAFQTVALGSRMVPPDSVGGVVSGRVLDAEGAPIVGAQVVYLNSVGIGGSIVGLAQHVTGADGTYQFDWVRRAEMGPFLIKAYDLATGGFQQRSTRIRNHGEHLVVDLVMRGRGGVTGLVTDLTATPVPGAKVLVTSDIDQANWALVETDGEGRYTATDILVGAVSVKAVSGTSSGLAAGNLQRAGTFETVDVTINTGVGSVTARALEVDGADVTTPVARAPIFYLVPSSDGSAELVAGSGDTDENGLFVFEDVPTGPFRIVAYDLVRGTSASKTGELIVAGTDVTINGCVDGECQVLFEEEAVGTITGEIRLASGAPAVGALVQAGGLQTTTAADGLFTLSSVSAGSHVVSATLGAGRRANTTINLVTGTTANVSLTLPGVGSVVVTLLDATGTPMVGHAVIRVTSGCAGVPVVTNAAGVAVFDDVPIPGGYFKALDNDDIADGYATVRSDGESASIALRFGGFGTVTGTVIDGNGDPVHGADVVLGAKVASTEYCAFLRHTRARQMKTDTDGVFFFDHVPVGAVSVSASSFFLPIPTGASGNLLSNGDVKNFALTLTSNIAGELNGTVYLPDGVTPAGAGVQVTISGARPDVTVVTDANGHYSFAKIFPAGRYTVVAADPLTGKVVKEWISLQADQDLTADLRLLGQGTVDVTVVDGGGAPIEDAFVELKGARYPRFQSAGAVTVSDNGKIQFTKVPEGSFSVMASDDEGRGGRAYGALVEDGSTVDVTVSMTVTGTVTGTYKTSDAATPIPNAEVTLRQGTGRFLGSTVTSSHPDTLGTFQFDFVPAGNVLVTAMDPLTGRLGESSGIIETQDEVLDLEILQLGSGTLSGTVTSGGSLVAAAEVRLISETGLSNAVPNLRAFATTDGAGAFVFDGVPVGRFDLRATVDGLLLVGNESGFIDSDGQQITDIEIQLAASGTLTGDVLRPDASTPVPAAELTIRPSTGTIRTDANSGGRYETSFVPVGYFDIEANDSVGPDAGIVSGELAEGETLEADVVFNGTGTVSGDARDFDDTSLSTGTVRLTRSAPFARDEWATVASNGTFQFFGIPVGTYNLSLTVPGEVRRGAASGEITFDGEVANITVKLADAGSVTGLVVKEIDGTTPAPNTVIEVKGTGFMLSALTGPDGRFDISGIPLGSVDVWANDPVTRGVAYSQGELATAGALLDVGTLVLDTEPIQVESITPASGSTVPPDTPIVLRFTDPTTMPQILGRFFVTKDGVSLAGARTLSEDGLELTMVPNIGAAFAFPPNSTIDVSLSGAVADTFGRRMGDNFASSFTTGAAVVIGTVFDGSAPAPGVDVTLTPTGGTAMTTTTDTAGTYRLENVPQGGIVVQVLNVSDGRGSSRSLTVGPAAGLVTVDFTLAFLGSVSGNVVDYDASALGAGLEVAVWVSTGTLATTTTDASGDYVLTNIPVGPVTVDVTDPVTGNRGRASATIPSGASVTADVTMQGTGSLRVYVRDASNLVVNTAPTRITHAYLAVNHIAATERWYDNLAPEGDGSYLFPYVNPGWYDLRATDSVSGLVATGFGNVAAGEDLVVDIVLQAAGSVRAIVRSPDGTTPVVGATVKFRRWNDLLPRETTVSDAAGEALFEAVPVNLAPYVVEVEIDGKLRARAREIGITNGVETTVTLDIAGLGTVSGQVIPPSGESLSANVRVDLMSLAAEVGGILADPNADDGTYLITNVPVGPFTVTARDNYQDFQGEVAGAITADGENVTVDISLLDNGITFSIYGNRLVDGNESQYLIRQDGRLDTAAETIIDGTGDALNLEVAVDGGAATAFAGLSTGFEEESGRELVTSTQDIDGVLVRRKIFVPTTGYFVRYLEVFENQGPADVTVTATLSSNLTSRSATYGDIALTDTSSGDAFIDAADIWLVVDDNKDEDPFEGSTTGSFTTAFVMAGESSFAPALVDFAPSGIDGILTTTYDVSVPAGGRAVVMHFMSQMSFRDSAREAATRLRQLPPEALVGLGLDELTSIVNFSVPADGVSSVEPLPPLDGKVFGQLLAHDGVTGVGGNTGVGALQARFHSDHILYRRVRTTNGDTDGNFSFLSEYSTNKAVSIPRVGFSLSSSRTTAGSTASASAVSDFISRSLLSRIDGLVTTATSEFNTSLGPDKAFDGNVNSEWRTATGVTTATLDMSFPSGVGIESIEILPDSLASLDQVQIRFLGDSGQELSARTEPFATPSGVLSVAVDPVVTGVHTIELIFDGATIRVNEIEVMGTTPVDIGTSYQEVVYTGSAGLRITGTRASGEGLQSTVFGRSVPTAVQAIGGTTDTDGVYALFAPLPPAIGPVDITLTATHAAAGHTFLETTGQAALTADTTTDLTLVYPETASVTGQLTSSAGVPLSGRSVNLFPSVGSGVTKTTDAGGFYAFENLPADTYWVRHVVNTRQLYAPPVPLSPPASQVQNLQIPAFGTVDLTVLVETPEGAPVQPAAASITITDSIDARTYSTNSSGLKTITNVAGGGAFTIDVKHPSDLTNITTGSGIITTDGELVSLTIVLPALGTVSGTVRYADGTTAASAAVELSGADVTPRVGTSNPSGAVTFVDVEGLRPFSLLAKHPAADRDYIFAVASGEVPGNGDTANVDVSLPGTGTVEVTVTELDGTTPLPGANVFIQDSFSGAFRAEGTSAADGTLDITIVPEGSFTLRAELPDEVIGTETSNVPAGAVGTIVPVTIVRSSNAAIEGVVHAADGTTPIPGAVVRLLTADGLTELDTRTSDAAGFYRFAAAVPIGDSALVRAELADDPGVNDEAAVTAATPGETIVRDLTLLVKVINGRVLESDGVTPVEGVAVDAIVEGGYVDRSGTTDANGDFTLTGVSEGTYELVATDAAGLRGFAAATLATGVDAVTQDVLLPAVGVVEGLILDAGGSPPVGVDTGEVALHNANADPPQVATPEVTGYYRFDRVAEGAFTAVYDDATSGLSGATTSYVTAGASLGEATDIAKAFGVTASAFSYYNTGYLPEKVLDGNDRSSWLTKYGDAANQGANPHLDVHLPSDATVSELRIFGHRQLSASFDVHAGRFELFDALDNVLFDSGIIDLPLPERDAVVAVPNVGSVRRVRFSPTDDTGQTSGFSELEIYGSLTSTDLAMDPGATLTVSSTYGSYVPERVNDGDIGTSWFSGNADAVNRGGSPFVEITLPDSATISEIQFYGTRLWSTSYIIYEGRFELFNSIGSVVFDSGILTLPAPYRDVTLSVPNVGGVTRLRFTPTDDYGYRVGVGEIAFFGSFETSDAPSPDINLPETGSVSGQLLASGGTPTVPTGTATVETASNDAEARTGVVSATDTVDAAGLYHATGVAEGNITVTVVDDGLGEAGRATATVTAGVETTGVDLELQTAQALPIDLGLPAGKRHLVRNDGSVEGELDLASAAAAFGTVTVNGKAYTGSTVAALELSGRQLVFGPVRMSGVDHTRKVYVPTGAAFARTLDIFENPHTFDVEVTVRLDGALNTTNLATSSGDALLDAADRYVAGELDTGVGLGVVYAGAGATRLPDASATNGAAYSTTWRRLVVPAGGRVIVMGFAVQKATRADAITEADALMSLSNASATSDLAPAEKTDIVNFIVP